LLNASTALIASSRAGTAKAKSASASFFSCSIFAASSATDAACYSVSISFSEAIRLLSFISRAYLLAILFSSSKIGTSFVS
jgi:hypothetical protein